MLVSDGWGWETINELCLAQIRCFSEEVAEARAAERADFIEGMAIAMHAKEKEIRKAVAELRGTLPSDAIIIPV